MVEFQCSIYPHQEEGEVEVPRKRRPSLLNTVDPLSDDFHCLRETDAIIDICLLEDDRDKDCEEVRVLQEGAGGCYQGVWVLYYLQFLHFHDHCS